MSKTNTLLDKRPEDDAFPSIIAHILQNYKNVAIGHLRVNQLETVKNLIKNVEVCMISTNKKMVIMQQRISMNKGVEVTTSFVGSKTADKNNLVKSKSNESVH